MAKRTRKPPVKPEKAREWLKRNEEMGESPPQIARSDGYDVRTVRKQLERMRQERELREAKQVVLRQALEKHYADICAFAENLMAKFVLGNPSEVPVMLKGDPMWKAMREHLPRSSIWRDITAWDRLVEGFRLSAGAVMERTRSKTEAKTGLKFVSSPKEIALIEGLPKAIVFHLQSLVEGGQGANAFTFSRTKTQTGIRLEWGAFTIGNVPEDKVEQVQEACLCLMKEATSWEENEALSKQIRELAKVWEDLKEEITRIILRRVVEGKCRYCPF